MKKKRVLLIHRFFYPDSPPYALILDDMRKILIKKGYEVDVLSSKPSYKSIDFKKNEKFKSILKDGSIIYRLPVFKFKNKRTRNLFNFLWFPIAVLFFLLLKRKYQIMTIATTPPVILGFFVSLIARLKKVSLIYHFMDIHPEIGKISGEFNNKYIYKVLEFMDNFSCKTAKNIIVLSTDMKKSLLMRNKNFEKKILIINNYDVNSENEFNNVFFKNSTKKRVLYAGNIGKFQGLDVFINILKNNKQIDNFELIFIGEGNRLEQLKELSKGLNNVMFLPHMPIEEVRKIISEVDMGIVSLEKNIINYAYPSKVMTYLAEGTPILVLSDKNSELEKFIVENNLGVFKTYENSQEIYDIFKSLSNSSLKFDKKEIKKVFNNSFSKEIFEKKIIDVFENL